MAKILQNPTLKIPKNPEKFHCKKCDYNTCSKKDFIKHEATQKHQKQQNPTKSYTKNPQKSHYCNCGKTYKHSSTFYAHKKKCLISKAEEENKNNNKNEGKENENEKVLELLDYPSKTDIVATVSQKNNVEIIDILINENKEFKNVILDLVKSNSELQKQMLNVCKSGITNNNNTTINNSNSHNKTFNLQFFLNEQCKDAMNIMDFVNTFQLQFSDLERIGEVGYVEGLSNIIIDKLNEMDVYKRPIHCSDAKREIMYVKDNDVWSKENENNDKLRLAVKHITKKNTDMIRPWANKHPGVLNSEHRLNDQYQEIIIEAMGGNNGTIKEGETKIIKKISKMVLIDKHIF